MNDSLSMIVPVRNAETTLAGQIHRLLDLLPDFTGRFEIIVVDDASSDHTVEVAAELARQYPQLRLIRHSQPLGHEAARTTGMSHSIGQTIIVQEDAAPPSEMQLRRLWSLRTDRGVVIARSQRQPGLLDPALLERLSTWGQSLRNRAARVSAGGIQMIRRDEAQSILLTSAKSGASPGANTAARTTAPTGRP